MVACCTGGELLPPLRSKTIHAEFCCNGKLMESYIDSLYGMTSAPSMESPGVERLISSLVDSLVKTLVPQGKAQGWRVKGRGYGQRWRGSSAKCDHATHSWKIAHSLLDEDSIPSSWTWPRSGTMRNGVCLERTMSVRRTNGNASGSWPTPTVAEANKIGGRANYGQKGLNNHPRIRGVPERPKAEKDRAGGMKTRQTYPTPTAHNAKEGNFPAESTRKTPSPASYAGGKLNPDWVEWLMGWPIGYTALKPLGMDRFHWWQQSHFNIYSKG